MPRNDKSSDLNTEKVNFEALGHIIKQARKKRGYSQYLLADIAKVHQATISKLENGKYNFHIDKILRIITTLNAELEFSLKLFNVDPIE